MNKTKIEWALNPDGTPGYTWNPITGCLNNCPYCYARRLANTRLRTTYLSGDFNNIAPIPEGTIHDILNDPFYPRLWEDRLYELSKAHEYRKGIFVCDMSDLFGIGIPEQWTRRVLAEIKACPYDRFYLLTKQPQNLPKFEIPGNCYVGATATNPQMFTNAVYGLSRIEAKVKYISFEPFLNWLDVKKSRNIEALAEIFRLAGIKWVIIGACTGTKTDMLKMIELYPSLTLMPYGRKWTARPKIEWVREIVEAADKAEVKVFLKDNLYYFLMDNPHSDLFWEDISHLRQEMPILNVSKE